MGSLLLFLSSFVHYMWAYAISIILIIGACVIGVKWRKSKDLKEAQANKEE